MKTRKYISEVSPIQLYGSFPIHEWLVSLKKTGLLLLGNRGLLI